MKWMLAVIMSVALVSPAFAAVDITLTAENGTNLIVLPAGTTSASIVLQVGLGATGPDGYVTSFGTALTMAPGQVGSGTFTVTARAAKEAGAVLGVSGTVLNSLSQMTTPPFTKTDLLLTAPGNNIAFGKVTGDLGLTSGSFWMPEQFPAVMDTLTVAVAGLMDGDSYTIVQTAPGAPVAVYDPMGNMFELGAIGSVTISVLPEPASLLLLALGGLFLRRRHA